MKNENKKIEDKKEKTNKKEKTKKKIVIPLKKMLLTLLLFLIIVFVVIITRRYIIFSKYAKDVVNYRLSNNYYIKNQSYEGSALTTSELYYKNGISLSSIQHITNQNEKRLLTTYSNPITNEYISLIETDTEKIVFKTDSANMVGIPSIIFPFEHGNYIWDRLYLALTTKSIKSKKCNGVECYEISLSNNYKLYIDKQTSLTVRELNGTISGDNGTYDLLTDHIYEFNNITDKDIQRPDISEYRLVENNN